MILTFGGRDQGSGGLKFHCGSGNLVLLPGGEEGVVRRLDFRGRQAGSGGTAMAGKEILHKVKDKVSWNGRGWRLLLVLPYGNMVSFFLATSN